jgi:hypothetical protein
MYRQNQLLKMRRKKIFFGTLFAVAKKAGHLAQDLQCAAIMAGGGRFLPYWQSSMLIAYRIALAYDPSRHRIHRRYS